MRTPSEIIQVCRRERFIADMCPTRLPKAIGYVAFVLRRSAAGEFITISVSHADESGDPRRDAPPRFAHVVVESGDLKQAFETFDYPQGGVPARIRNGLLRSREREHASNPHAPRALWLGRVRWGGKSGTLVLVPSFKYVDSVHASHLIFRWQEGSINRDVSLHAWEPFLQSVKTLRAVVESVPQ